MDRKTFGDFCEEQVAQYLEIVLGWQVLERKVRFKEGEIDLICLKGRELRFVEVKGRRSRKFGSVVEALTTQKIRKIRKAVIRWRCERRDWRIGALVFVGVFENENGVLKLEKHLI